MDAKLVKNGENEATLYLEGRVNAKVAPELDKLLQDLAGRFTILTIDMKDVTYISSAGLRALRNLYVALSRKGGKTNVRSVRKDVMDIFNVTGFSMLLGLNG